MTKWISRASVMRIIDADPVYSDVINEKTYMASQISNLPTKEETSRPHGEWKHMTVCGVEFINCSNCGCGCPSYSYVKKGETEEKVQHCETEFCPHCGADMRVKNELNRVSKELNGEIEKSKSEINPCIECCKIDNSEPCRKGCSDYQKWKEGEAE